ncbi:hypothetical protein SASPL_136365 [Salvia splendens]|uniref:KUP system potassium uptake protein n=1 Tax=Salvia splendens TaxID=180675 RepID=A0A8X8WZS6_SALSN|nr:hypothetical protein SASPL_136365 [Salvia splendens]
MGRSYLQVSVKRNMDADIRFVVSEPWCNIWPLEHGSPVDDYGEGGPFSLYSLLCRHAKVWLIPSNSGSSKMLSHERRVLSATSGLGRSLAEVSQVFYSDKRKDHVANAFKKYLPAPVACAILVGLFMLQHHGTKRIGSFFAPIIITWLLIISGSGLYNIIHYDAQILRAVSPVYMLRFLRKFNLRHGKLLSSTVLCIAGSEAMFADLGHFSKKSIKITFICFVYPVLLLTYAGQAAFISKNLHADGAFHLSESIPRRLSVTTCLLVTSCLMSLVIALYWEKHLFASVSFLLFFGSVEAIYLTSTLTSFFHGAWCLFILFVFFMSNMAAWHYGTLKKYESDVENKVSIEWLTDYSPSLGVSRVPGIGFVYSDVDTGIPAFFTHFISNIAAFHQVVVFVTFKASPVPYVHESRRDTDDFEDDIIRSIGEFIMREEYDHE